MKSIRLNEVLKAFVIEKLTPEDLLALSPWAREKYYKEHTWSHGIRDEEPLEFDEPEWDDEGQLMIYFDDRWLKGAK